MLTLVLLNDANSVDPYQLASESIWSGPALLVINYVSLYQQPEASNLIGWKLEVSVVSWFIQHGNGQETSVEKNKQTWNELSVSGERMCTILVNRLED